MPELASALQPFEQAAATVEEWLDGAGAALATRSRQPDPRRKVASWDLELEHPLVGKQRVRFSIRRDFPATAPQVHFDKKLCLVLPHIEEDGRFCHGIDAEPEDYDWPVARAVKVIERLQWFLEQSADSDWVRKEFQNERLAYWPRFCEQFRASYGSASPHDVRVALEPLDGVQEGKIAAYYLGSRKDRSALMVATFGEVDPHALAVRHGWHSGTLVRGNAVYVPLPEQHTWTPLDWPRTLAELEALVAALTDNEFSVTHWAEAHREDAPHPLMAVLVQGTVCYGYLIGAPAVPLLTLPGIVPVPIERIDANWALSRDQDAPVLTSRRAKRVLLLGCGSLGSPVAELLARGGIGELHLLDKELFNSENCARHVLGAADIGLGKAASLAKRLRLAVPGVNVKAITALAADWVRSVSKPNTYDLVIDCTGESSVRTVLARYRKLCLGACPVVHAWMEPYCAAAHVVYLESEDAWPLTDPFHLVNVASWPEGTEVKLPACSAGFHPYGAADAWQAAGFTAERLLAALDRRVSGSTVWTWVRSKAYFDALPVVANFNARVPDAGDIHDARHVTRSLAGVLSGG